MSKEHILVVEDTKLTRLLIQSRLTAESYDVTAVDTATQALQAIRTRMPDLVVLDLTLANDEPFAGLTDGFGVLSMLRRNYPDVDTVVIVYSVSHSDGVVKRCTSLGATAVIDKKDGIPPLLHAVRTTLDARKRKQAAASTRTAAKLSAH